MARKKNNRKPKINNSKPLLEDRVVMLEKLKKSQSLIEKKGSELLKDIYLDNDKEEMSKALNLVEGDKNENDEDFRSLLFQPNGESQDINGYKRAIKVVTFNAQRGMANTPIISGIISTRVEQVQNYSQFTTDLDKEGWTITKRAGRFDNTKEIKLSSEDKKSIDKIATFLENCGSGNRKFDMNSNFVSWLSATTRDSLSFDQATSEIQRNRMGELYSFGVTDPSLIRLLETIDPNYVDTGDYEKLKYKGKEYYPYFTQIWRQNIVINPKTNEKVIFYPWELMFGVRNRTSNIYNNGYGVSELEILVQIVTYILWGFQYNGNFFKNGSNPRGFFSMKENADPRTMNRFRKMWRQTMTGTANSHRIPFFEGGEVVWNDMQTTNKDMEFQNWNEFLILIACMVYHIAPEELGFNFKQQTQMFGQDGQEARLEHSKKKGLTPLLQHIQSWINKWIVSEIDENFEFKFTGINIEDIDGQIDRDIKLSKEGFTSLEDNFKKYSERDLDKEKDTILNQVYQTAKQAEMYGAGGAEGDQYSEDDSEETEENENPFVPKEDNMEKAVKDLMSDKENPMVDILQKWVDINF